MKSIKKKLIWSIAALLVSVAIFYAGKMSLKIEESLAGGEYSILLNGNIYEGIVNEGGIVNFPWNPLREGGLATIEIGRNGKELYRAAHNFNPTFGRHVIYPDQSEWAMGHITYIFGMPIREIRQSGASIANNQNQAGDDNSE